MARIAILLLSLASLTCGPALVAQPKPPGRMVKVGSQAMHIHCMGKGSPTVVVEYGLGDFSFDWILVQTRVAKFTRVCTYDRGGYAWSEPGPEPRTFAQLNLELRTLLEQAGERTPFVLVGHSFGGPVARNFALTYPKDVEGLVLVDSAHENQYVRIPNKTVRIRDGAKGLPIPSPRLQTVPVKAQLIPSQSPPATQKLDPPLDRLPPAEQKLQLWAQALPGTDKAEESQREWSTEYFARWHSTPQSGTLGNIPLTVLARQEGGYPDGLDIPAAQIDAERKNGQAQLAQLSTRGKLVWLPTGHNMQLEAPEQVSQAIRDVVETVRKEGRR